MSTPTLTDSGLETWLVFHRSTDLPDFAAFPLLDDAGGRKLLAEYFRDHLRIAAAAGTGLVLETPTWRANADWGARAATTPPRSSAQVWDAETRPWPSGEILNPSVTPVNLSSCRT